MYYDHGVFQIRRIAEDRRNRIIDTRRRVSNNERARDIYRDRPSL